MEEADDRWINDRMAGRQPVDGLISKLIDNPIENWRLMDGWRKDGWMG